MFFYNKDMFKKAGLDPNKPPKTWDEAEQDALKLKDAGIACPFTTAWQSWVQLETMSAWHNLPFATEQNGFGGMDAKLVFNDAVLVRHIAKLSSWVKSGLFIYAGRENQPDAKFTGGDCAMSYRLFRPSMASPRAVAKFAFGVSELPYYPDVKGAPQNTIIGGASLWVMGGKKPIEYKGVAKFFTFLSSPEIQAEWHQKTGYVPITKAAYELSKKQGFYEKNPGTDVAIEQLLLRNPTVNTKGIRLGNFPQIRTIIDEELEAVWAQKKGPKQALDDAVERGNVELRKFERANKAGSALNPDRPKPEERSRPGPFFVQHGKARSVPSWLAALCRWWRPSSPSPSYSSSGPRRRRCGNPCWCRTPSAPTPSSSGSKTSRSCSPTRPTSSRSRSPRCSRRLVAVLALAIALVLAACCDHVLRGAKAYQTLIIWPYAVAPAVAAVLWAFMFNPTSGHHRLLD